MLKEAAVQREENYRKERMDWQRRLRIHQLSKQAKVNELGRCYLALEVYRYNL